MDFTPVFNQTIPNMPESIQIYHFLQKKHKKIDQKQLGIIFFDKDFKNISYVTKPVNDLFKVDGKAIVKLIRYKHVDNFYLISLLPTIKDYSVDGKAKLVDTIFEELRFSHCKANFVDFIELTPEFYSSDRDTGYWRHFKDE